MTSAPVAAVRNLGAGVSGQGYPLISYLREEVAMCSGDRLVADFIAGTDARPGLPEELDEHLTTTVNGQWVVCADLERRAMFTSLRGKYCTGGNPASESVRPAWVSA